MKRLLCFALVLCAVAAGTWLTGWWAVPLIAVVAGALACAPLLVAAASAAAWLVLLLVDAATGSVGRLAGLLGGIMGLPAAALFAATLVFPALLGWSAASLGNAARSLRATSRPPSSAPAGRRRSEW